VSTKKSIDKNSPGYKLFLSLTIIFGIVALIGWGFASNEELRPKTTEVGPNTILSVPVTEKITVFQPEGLVIQGNKNKSFCLKNIQTGVVIEALEIPPAVGEDTSHYAITDLDPGLYQVQKHRVSLYSTQDPVTVTTEHSLINNIILSFLLLLLFALFYVMILGILALIILL